MNLTGIEQTLGMVKTYSLQGKINKLIGITYRVHDEVKSQNYFSEAADCDIRAANLSRMSYRYTHAGDALRLLGRPAEAIQLYTEAIAEAVEEDNSDVAVRARKEMVKLGNHPAVTSIFESNGQVKFTPRKRVNTERLRRFIFVIVISLILSYFVPVLGLPILATLVAVAYYQGVMIGIAA